MKVSKSTLLCIGRGCIKMQGDGMWGGGVWGVERGKMMTLEKLRIVPGQQR